MKIVIFTGGTGSIALQRGLYRILESQFDGVDTKIVVNAYDNGLSTGTVRQVMGGRILGPSDVRKNQTTRLHLQNPTSPWLSFLSERFTARSDAAHSLCASKVAQLVSSLERAGEEGDCRYLLLEALENFFAMPLAASIEYRDFSLANLVYAGLAAANRNSLRIAGAIMANAMKIANSVILNDDESLFLGAITREGRRVSDEGEIVCWGNESDPFVNIFFTNAEGRASWPNLCVEAWRAIVEADLIILSSGTLWSSLIPTYASDGFRSAMNSSTAHILMIMNRVPDRDSPGQTATDIVNTLVPRYFDAHRLHVIADKNAQAPMNSVSSDARDRLVSFTTTRLSGPETPAGKHDPNLLASAVSRVFFGDYLDSGCYIFDYDDTLVGRNRKCPQASLFNVAGVARLNSLTDVAICSGNTVRAIKIEDVPKSNGESTQRPARPLRVFADGGINEYIVDLGTMTGEAVVAPPTRCVWPAALLSDDGGNEAMRIVSALQRAGIPQDHIEIRGDAVIAIRPVEERNRQAIICLVSHLISGSDLMVRERGTTTIEICRPALSKSHALRQICGRAPANRFITYVGDELESGNDHDIARLVIEEPKLRCLHVDSPAKTAFFIATLIERLQANDGR